MVPNSFANHLFVLSMTEVAILRAVRHCTSVTMPKGPLVCKLRLLNAVISWTPPSLRTEALHDNDHHTKSPPHHAPTVLYLGHWYSNSCSAWRVVLQ